ncbi:chemotaxis protein CheW, partial [Deltaproteobacteria bacterium OttesenSCG-928-K17]|nr:chemotaxis protein CheW [Deltaproteobacteria bacterium OttesenSCG-928-K17]
MTGKPTENIAAEGGAPPELDRMAVKISHLDKLLGLTGEIIITASNISILQRHLSTSSSGIDKNSMDLVKNAALTANRISSDLHHLVMDIRMVPIKDTFLRFRRLVRDIAKKKGRQVNFEIVGEDTLVDKTVAEKLYEPLAHQIRNAIDHGLEDPLERQHNGKDPTGQLTLTAYKKEGFTYVSVTDDGRGLDENRIRQVAVEKGFLAGPAAAALGREECWSLIMLPGFSTNVEATEISGRGVGMDVVKSTVEALGGEIVIETVPNRGTVFTYKIPQLSAVNITDALIIRAGESYCAVPIGNVVATQAFDQAEIITTMETTESIKYLGAIIPLYDLRGLLSGSPLSEWPDSIPVIIIDSKNGRIALKVSEFIRP